MNTQPIPAEPEISTHQQACHQQACHQQADSQRADDAEYFRRVLRSLVEIGADFACMLQQHERARMMAAVAGGDPIPSPANIVALDRVSRCTRRNILLSEKLAQPAPTAAASRAETQRTVARRRIIREVEDDIHRKTTDADARSFREELLERLDAPDLDDDIDNRPIAEIIAEIRHDLGLGTPPGQKPDYPRRTPADIALLSARAARTGASCCKKVRGPAPWSPA